MSVKRYESNHQKDLVPMRFGRWIRYEDHVAEVERLRSELAEEQAESLRQAEIARDALAEVERSHALLRAVADAKNLRDIERAINRIRGTHKLT